MFCKVCGTEIQNGNFCPECGAKIVKKQPLLLRVLIILGIIGITSIIMVNGNSKICGFKIINLYYLTLLIMFLVSMVWMLIKFKTQLRINNIKQKYNEIPEDYKNMIFMGYYSLILLFINLYFNILTVLLYGTLNENWGGPLTIISLIAGLLLYLITLTRFILKRKYLNKTLKTHLFDMVIRNSFFLY